jgi:diguanylate cyclase
MRENQDGLKNSLMLISDPTDPARSFEAAHALAQRILAVAEAARLPLNPKVFRVLYEAETGAIELTARVPAGSGTAPAPPDVVELERLHDLLFAADGEQSSLSQIGTRLQREIDDVNVIVAGRVDGDAAFLEVLRDARRRFGIFTRPSDAKRVLADLTAESQGQADRIAGFLEELAARHRQIGELQRELHELRDRVNRDHLTGLASRRHFDERMVQEFEIARRTGAPLSIGICDLDHFKKVNDSWGHGVGDSILQQFASVLRNNLKGKDVVARYGGEEFAIILPGTSSRDARTVLEHIRQIFHSRNFVVSKTQQVIGHLSASFGVTELAPADTAESVIARADQFLYEAKRRGRNNVVSDFSAALQARIAASG